MKKVDSAIQDNAAGDGWFKIWELGYDESTHKWCTTKVIENGGFVTVDIPKGLEGGNYLVRSELMSLHQVPRANQPQYYIGCAQIFLESTGNLKPTVTGPIPGTNHLGDASNSMNIYEPLKLPYSPPGPPVTSFKAGPGTSQKQQTEGAKPSNCILESGSNFCGVEAPDYNTASGCWAVRLST
jgi:hypothetical protein